MRFSKVKFFMDNGLSKVNISTQKWLVSAKHDLDLAFLIERDGGFSDTVCYFCHQTAEKSLKAVLISHGILDFPHTHKLKVLQKQIMEFNSDISQFTDEITQLDKYYIETKYPSDFPVDYPREEAQKAINYAEKIYGFIEKEIGNVQY